ncbi:hypothetical protein LCGC14_1535760 [marine sediment metagenome]|uniref:Uncharacterized protein n=1 Tax=marine sediment metagenome TaxID=412755 RepID=A0A0F9LA93_9ZZZZ|nr:hypothetical protein [bacterium]
MKFDKYKKIKKRREKNILRVPETKLDITLKKSLMPSFYEEHPNAPVVEVFFRKANILMAKEGKITIKELKDGMEIDWSLYESQIHYK